MGSKVPAQALESELMQLLGSEDAMIDQGGEGDSHLVSPREFPKPPGSPRTAN